MDTGLTSEYINSLRDEVKRYKDDVVGGKCSTYDQYKFKTGYIQGVLKAEQILHDVISDMLKDQDIN